MVWFLLVTLLGSRLVTLLGGDPMPRGAPARDWRSPPPHAILLLALPPGTEGQAILRYFGRPNLWGHLT
jgi:hypothetical protein